MTSVGGIIAYRKTCFVLGALYFARTLVLTFKSDGDDLERTKYKEQSTTHNLFYFYVTQNSLA